MREKKEGRKQGKEGGEKYGHFPFERSTLKTSEYRMVKEDWNDVFDKYQEKTSKAILMSYKIYFYDKEYFSR